MYFKWTPSENYIIINIIIIIAQYKPYACMSVKKQQQQQQHVQIQTKFVFKNIILSTDLLEYYGWFLNGNTDKII